jgi:hypothetical protein
VEQSQGLLPITLALAAPGPSNGVVAVTIEAGDSNSGEEECYARMQNKNLL